MGEEYKFVVDINAGKLARWLRIIGYDTLLFTETDDGVMLKIALKQNRVILTRDGQLLKRRLITSGKIKAILVQNEDSRAQLRQVVQHLDLDYDFRPFTLCLECNQELISKAKEEISDRIPPRVYEKENTFMECPQCHRIYWKGTHWEAMRDALKSISQGTKTGPEVNYL